jgi:hypothetical protein
MARGRSGTPENCTIFSSVRLIASAVRVKLSVIRTFSEASSDWVEAWLSGAARSIVMKKADR